MKRSIGPKPVPNDDKKFECNALGFVDDGAEFLQNAFPFIWTIAFFNAIEGCRIQLPKSLKSFPQVFKIRRHGRSKYSPREMGKASCRASGFSCASGRAQFQAFPN